MCRNAQPAEEILVLRLHPSHYNLHGQNPCSSVGEEGGHELSCVLTIVPPKLDVTQGVLALVLHVGEVGPERLHLYSGHDAQLTEL